MIDPPRRRVGPVFCSVCAGATLAICLVSGAVLVLSFDPFDDLDKGDMLVVNLYAIGLSALGTLLAGVFRALRLGSWVTAASILLSLTIVIAAYRVITY